MERRIFMAAGAAACALRPALAETALPVPPGSSIGFQVFRNGVDVGEHHMTFSQQGETLTGVTDFAFIVKVLGLVAYTYSLHAVETWTSGVFQSVESQVNNNGTHTEVHAHKTASGYDVVNINHENPAKAYPKYTAPADTMPLTYWNKGMLQGTVLNVATAHSYPTIVKSPGWSKLTTAGGGSLTAKRFDVTGKLHLTVWYDQVGQWSGLAFQIHGAWNYEKIT